MIFATLLITEKCYDRRYFAFFGFLIFCIFLFFLGVEGYENLAFLASPASLFLLIFIPRDIEKVPEAYRLRTCGDIFNAFIGKF